MAVQNLSAQPAVTALIQARYSLPPFDRNRWLKSPQDLESLLQTITYGWSLGLQAQPLLAQKWEDYWDKPLSQWRIELNLESVLDDSSYF